MFLILSTLLAGVSLCCVVWVIVRPVAGPAFAARASGQSLVILLAWPWVIALKPLCEPVMSWRARARLSNRLELAGLASMLEPAHVLALQVVVFIAGAISTSSACVLVIGLPLTQALLWGGAVGSAAACLPPHTIASAGRRRQQQMLRELPFLLDMTTLCVEAGLSLHGALQQAARHGPAGPLRQELRNALSDIRAGMPRADALWKLADRTRLQAVASLVAALAQADQTGSSLGPLLRAQSDQRRAERFLRAEESALKAPVKMLFPLVICIFPCTFLVIAFPIVTKLLRGAF